MDTDFLHFCHFSANLSPNHLVKLSQRVLLLYRKCDQAQGHQFILQVQNLLYLVVSCLDLQTLQINLLALSYLISPNFRQSQIREQTSLMITRYLLYLCKTLILSQLFMKVFDLSQHNYYFIVCQKANCYYLPYHSLSYFSSKIKAR